MAVNYTRQAQKQLNPAYNKQARALSGQIPSVNKAYSALSQGLDYQFQGAVQNNLEDASSRGLLRSTIPVDAYAGLQQGLIQERGQLGQQRGQEIAGIRSDVAGVRVQQASAVSELVNALRTRALEAKRLQQQKALANRQFQFDQENVNRGLF